MGAPTIPYTFVNSTTANADEVNSNFTAIVNGITDGSKQLNISTLTAGNAFVTTGTIGTVIATNLSAVTAYLDGAKVGGILTCSGVVNAYASINMQNTDITNCRSAYVGNITIASSVTFSTLPLYGSNASAFAGGLTTGMVYQYSGVTGVRTLGIVY